MDANGGYGREQAARMARDLEDYGVTWFEEPVSSDDLDGLREVRDQARADIAAGESGYDLPYFARMVEAEGALSPRGGALRPDPERAGFGVELKDTVAGQYRVA